MTFIRRFAFFFRRSLWRFLNRHRFRKLGVKTYIETPLRLEGTKNISLGNRVLIKYKTWLAAVPLEGDECILDIGDGTHIGNFNHIYATRSIKIGRKVLIADKVYISDNLHVFDDPHSPIIDQPVRSTNPVIIGEGTWIGENVSILGATIGRNCVIGSNSVVTKNISDFSVAVGAPARVIKRYCFETSRWRKLDNFGNFIN